MTVVYLIEIVKEGYPTLHIASTEENAKRAIKRLQPFYKEKLRYVQTALDFFYD